MTRLWLLWLTFEVVWGAPNVTAPIAVKERRGQAHIPGAYLMAAINIKIRDVLCEKLKNQLDFASQTINLVQNSKLTLEDQNFVKKLGYYLLNIEQVINNIMAYITSLSICPNEFHQPINRRLESFQIALGKIWNLTKKTKLTSIVSLHSKRPPIYTYPLKPEIFPPILIGLGTGLVTGGVLGSIFGKPDHSKDIDKINTNLNNINKKNFYVAETFRNSVKRGRERYRRYQNYFARIFNSQ